MQSDTSLDILLRQCRLWALAAMLSFALSLCVFFLGIRSDSFNRLIPFAIFLTAILWLGTTALYRHSYVRLRTAMGKKIGLLEFLATNFVFILFPFVYRKLKKEVESFQAGRPKNQQS